MKIEFGDTAIQLSDRLYWWEILQLSRHTTIKEIKAQYRQLVAVNQGDYEQVKLLNFALNQRLKAKQCHQG